MIWALCLVSILSGAAGAFLTGKLAPQFGLIDSPSVRSSHRTPTPRGGGCGILLAACFSAVLLDMPPPLWAPPVFIGVVSFWDDWRGLSAQVRLLMQLLAGLSVLPVLEISAHFGTGGYFLLALAYMIFLVGTANFFNFMDGINGMAGISAVVGFSLVAIFVRLRGADVSSGLFSWALALACLGFLPFNFPRAKVFLGDVGSVFLGFQFGVLVVFLSHSVGEFLALAGALAPIYFDALLTLLRRWRKRENLFQAHRQHLYQDLVHSCGWRHWQVSLLYGLLQLVIGSLVLVAWYFGSPWLIVGILTVAAALFAGASLRICRLRQQLS